MRAYILISAAALIFGSGVFSAEARGGRGGGGGLVSVRGYYTSRGTYVAPHLRTTQDGILSNNLSYRGAGAAAYGGSIWTAGHVDMTPATADTNAQPISSGVPIAPVAPAEPWCARGKIAGSGVGFCLIN